MGALPQYLDHNRPDDRLAVLRLRSEVRAFLYSIGDLDLQTAVDELEHFAHSSGLTRELGADMVQWIIGSAFEPYRRYEYAGAR